MRELFFLILLIYRDLYGFLETDQLNMYLDRITATLKKMYDYKLHIINYKL
jgi:hypothetical protein